MTIIRKPSRAYRIQRIKWYAQIQPHHHHTSNDNYTNIPIERIHGLYSIIPEPHYMLPVIVQLLFLWWLHGLEPTKLFCPWDFPGKATGVGCQWDPSPRDIPYQGLNLCLLHQQADSLALSPQRSPYASYKRQISNVETEKSWMWWMKNDKPCKSYIWEDWYS